jgi:fructose-1,6-bisphosphatase II
MDRNLALEFVRVTESAAIAAAAWVGRGEGKLADGAAVDEMRDRFNQIDFSGRIVVGEGSKDESPELYTGEIVGKGGKPEMDLAVDPLECTDSVAYGRYNALSVIAAGPRGSLLEAPDTYMEKLGVGPKGASVIDIDAPIATNIKKVAKALGKKVGDLTVLTLERDRHQYIIDQTRAAGARIRLITDGDVAGAIATCVPDSGIDLLITIGGSAEAVIAGAAMKTLGGERQRIGIARAIIKDPSILIFDEATSALDTINEKFIKEAIDNVSKGKTTIIIAHRLSTVIDCDIIFVMDKGKIVASGSHEELLEKSEVYQNLIKHQELK